MTGGIRLRVLTYNVHSQRDDLTALGEVVRQIAPDIAIIQEAPRRMRWRQRSAGLARRTGLVVGGGGLPALGNLILTSLRVGVHRTQYLRFPLTAGRHLRGAVLLNCSVARTRFVVVGSHLSLDATERATQAALLKQELAAAAGPVIVGADLNENSGGSAWRTLSDGLTDAATATGHGQTGTFPAGDPRERIDAVFCDPRCTVLDYQVVSTDAARAASDHLPVVADILLPT